jgi:hypothetical protein
MNSPEGKKAWAESEAHRIKREAANKTRSDVEHEARYGKSIGTYSNGYTGDTMDVTKFPDGALKFKNQRTGETTVLLHPTDSTYISSSAADIEQFEAKLAAQENESKKKVMTLLKSITVVPELGEKCENDKCFAMGVGERIATWKTDGQWRKVKAMSGKYKGEEGWAVLYVDQMKPLGR